uniref:Uncharacterized protein n=1 Tax=Panagrolaimus sp. ES5 TaxID=591445 RepID=A0AC34FHQ0_9BILA
MGLDRWIQHSYPNPRVIKINQTGVPSSWGSGVVGMMNINNHNNNMNGSSNNILHARISPTTTSSSSYNTASTDIQYSPSSYSTIQDDKFHPEYEEPENVYERPPDVVGKKNLLPKSPPPLPPPLLNVTTLQKQPSTTKPINPTKSEKPVSFLKFMTLSWI